MSDTIDFWIDLSSPYAYLASERIEDIAAKHGRKVRWRPFMLGAVFKTEETKPLVFYPRKGKYSEMDLARSAREHGIPFRIPSKFPVPTVAASRAFYAIEEASGHDAARDYARAVFRAYYVDDRDISDAEVALDIAKECGHDRAAVAEAIASPEIKGKFKEATDTAIEELGIFGAPFIIVDGEAFWGNDRLEMVDRWLERGGW